MATTIALLGVITFVVFMVIFHNLRKWCAPWTSSTKTSDMPLASPSKPTSKHNSYARPSHSAYAIEIAELSPIEPPPLESSKVSFIRFSGYTDSDVSSEARNTAISFWTWLDEKDAENRAPAVTKPVEPIAPVEPAKPARVRPYIPSLREMHDPDAVEIGVMPGVLERNLLAYKPYNPRSLTTKHLMKHPKRSAIFIV